MQQNVAENTAQRGCVGASQLGILRNSIKQTYVFIFLELYFENHIIYDYHNFKI